MWRCVCPFVLLIKVRSPRPSTFFPFFFTRDCPILDNRFGVDPNLGQDLQCPPVYCLGGNKLLAHLDVHAASLRKTE